MGFIEDRLLKINFHKHFHRLSSFAKDLENDKELVLREAGAMDIFCEGGKLGREYLGKKWICSTDETPEDMRDIWINIKGEPVVLFGYYYAFNNIFVDMKNSFMQGGYDNDELLFSPNNNLYWQYAEVPKPVEVKNV